MIYSENLPDTTVPGTPAPICKGSQCYLCLVYLSRDILCTMKKYVHISCLPFVTRAVY